MAHNVHPLINSSSSKVDLHLDAQFSLKEKNTCCMLTHIRTWWLLACYWCHWPYMAWRKMVNYIIGFLWHYWLNMVMFIRYMFNDPLDLPVAGKQFHGSDVCWEGKCMHFFLSFCMGSPRPKSVEKPMPFCVYGGTQITHLYQIMIWYTI